MNLVGYHGQIRGAFDCFRWAVFISPSGRLPFGGVLGRTELRFEERAIARSFSLFCYEALKVRPELKCLVRSRTNKELDSNKQVLVVTLVENLWLILEQ